MGSRKKQTVGYRYLFGLHMGLSRGLDELVAIKVGDRTAWTGSATANTSITITQPELFGGDDKEGGIVGQLDLMMGEPTQTVNARLAAMLGGLVPAFRGVVTTFFDGLMCSGSPYPKKWAFRGRRALKGWDGEPWYAAKAVIDLFDQNGQAIKAMNPAHVLYECFTNGDWGRGLQRARLDDAAWRAAADKLHSEGFGLCLKWSRQDALSAFMQGVIDHIGAVQYVDTSSGLVVLKLIRDDYDPAALPLFDADSGLISIDDDDAGSQGVAVNEVVVRYRDPVTNQDRQVRVKNTAAIQALGGVSSTTTDYAGVPTAGLALRLAQRDLRAAGGFIKKFKVRLDRRGYGVLPGSVFRIRDLDRSINNLVLRAGRVEAGTVGDGAITITALQDVFGLPATSYVTPQPGGYVPPSAAPTALTGGRLIEVPYRELVRQLDASTLASLVSSAGYVGAVGGLPNTVTQGFELRSRVGTSGAFVAQGEGAACPVASLSAAMTATTTAITLASAVGLSRVAMGTPALIDDEIVRVDAIDPVAGTATVARGCGDTVPRSHAAGALVLFYGDTGLADDQEFSSGTVLQGKLLTRTSTGVLAEGAAATLSATLASRQVRPYPPADLRIAGLRYPASLSDTAPVLQWSGRNRTTQGDQLIDTMAGNVNPEPGTTYSVELRNGTTDALLHAASDIAGGSYTPPALPGTFALKVAVWAVRGGIESWQRAEHTLNYSAPVVAPGATFNVGVQYFPAGAGNGSATAPSWTFDVAVGFVPGHAYQGDRRVLLLEMEGPNGSTNFVDTGPLARVVTTRLGVSITTADAAFGASSARFTNIITSELLNSGAVDYHDQGLFIGSGTLPEYAGFAQLDDWTVRGRAKLDRSSPGLASSFTALLAIESVIGVLSYGVVLGFSVSASGGVLPYWAVNGIGRFPQMDATFVSADSWFDFAFTSEKGKWRGFIEGKSKIREPDELPYRDWVSGGGAIFSASEVRIGSAFLRTPFRGWLDRLAIDKACLYKNDFDPSTTPI